MFQKTKISNSTSIVWLYQTCLTGLAIKRRCFPLSGFISCWGKASRSNTSPTFFALVLQRKVKRTNGNNRIIVTSWLPWCSAILEAFYMFVSYWFLIFQIPKKSKIWCFFILQPYCHGYELNFFAHLFCFFKRLYIFLLPSETTQLIIISNFMSLWNRKSLWQS
jgi:hypothetical protein